MAHGSNFSIRSAISGKGVPGNIHLYLGIAFREGSNFLMVVNRNSLKPDDEEEAAVIMTWRTYDPRRDAPCSDYILLTLSEDCTCRGPKSTLRMHDMDVPAFNAFIKELLSAKGGLIRFLVELEVFDEAPTGFVARRITISAIE